MSHRELKVKLWQKDPRCHYCRQPTILTNITEGQLPPNAATIDHTISKFHIGRWIKRRKHHKPRRVLACSACNQKRSHQEILALSKAELIRRSQGYSLSPKGKPTIIKTLKNKREVIKALGMENKA